MTEGGWLQQRMEGDEVYLDKQLVITRTGSPSRLSVSGSIDYYNAEAVASALARELQSPSQVRTGCPTRSWATATSTST